MSVEGPFLTVSFTVNEEGDTDENGLIVRVGERGKEHRTSDVTAVYIPRVGFRGALEDSHGSLTIDGLLMSSAKSPHEQAFRARSMWPERSSDQK